MNSSVIEGIGRMFDADTATVSSGRSVLFTLPSGTPILLAIHPDGKVALQQVQRDPNHIWHRRMHFIGYFDDPVLLLGALEEMVKQSV